MPQQTVPENNQNNYADPEAPIVPQDIHPKAGGQEQEYEAKTGLDPREQLLAPAVTQTDKDEAKDKGAAEAKAAVEGTSQEELDKLPQNTPKPVEERPEDPSRQVE